ncbi:hypothetical protein L6R50_11435 [Myxococcota bacterium]|nr:hypothetical protein [Myxococcota bacterium]
MSPIRWAMIALAWTTATAGCTGSDAQDDDAVDDDTSDDDIADDDASDDDATPPDDDTADDDTADDDTADDDTADDDTGPPGDPPAWAGIQWPHDATVALGEAVTFYGRVHEPGVTVGVGQGAGIEGQCGFGGPGSDPALDASWEWASAGFNVDADGLVAGDLANDEYMAELSPALPGEYDVACRFRLNGGAWLYADVDGTDDGYDPADAARLVVEEGGGDDDTAPGDDDTADDDTADDDTAPGDDDTAPGDDDTAPGDDDTAPGDDDTAPGDDDTSPGDDDTADDDTADDDTADDDTAPAAYVAWAILQHPPEVVLEPGGAEVFYGRVFVEGRTPGPGAGAGVEAEAGWGPAGTDPRSAPGWTFEAAPYAGDVDGLAPGDLSNDEYSLALGPPDTGAFSVAYRFRVDGGEWTYADLGGTDDGFSPDDLASLTVAGDIAEWCTHQWPDPIALYVGGIVTVYGRVYADGVTADPGASPDVVAEVGVGPDGSLPWDGGWDWHSTIFNAQYGNDDEYRLDLGGYDAGGYDLAWRFSLDAGTSWLYCDAAPDGSADGYSVDTAVTLDVVPGET